MIAIGIDAANLDSGGAKTHLRVLLHAANPDAYGVGRVVVWGAEKTLALIAEQPWLVKRSPQAPSGGLLKRARCQRFSASKDAVSEGCDVRA